MTVKELIEKLKEFPEDIKVIDSEYYEEITEVLERCVDDELAVELY